MPGTEVRRRRTRARRGWWSRGGCLPGPCSGDRQAHLALRSGVRLDPVLRRHEKQWSPCASSRPAQCAAAPGGKRPWDRSAWLDAASHLSGRRFVPLSSVHLPRAAGSERDGDVAVSKILRGYCGPGRSVCRSRSVSASVRNTASNQLRTVERWQTRARGQPRRDAETALLVSRPTSRARVIVIVLAGLGGRLPSMVLFIGGQENLYRALIAPGIVIAAQPVEAPRLRPSSVVRCRLDSPEFPAARCSA